MTGRYNAHDLRLDDIPRSIPLLSNEQYLQCMVYISNLQRKGSIGRPSRQSRLRNALPPRRAIIIIIILFLFPFTSPTPIQPAPPVVPYALVSSFPDEFRSGSGPLAGTAVED